MRARGPALRRRQGRRGGRPGGAVATRAGERLAPLHAGDDPLRRPEGRRHGARHGHQRAGDGLVHGHLFDVPGDHRAGDRHRQAGRLRRYARPARGDRPRRRLPRFPGDGAAGDRSAQRDGDRPGLRQRRLARSARPRRSRGQDRRLERPHHRLPRPEGLRRSRRGRSRGAPRRPQRFRRSGGDRPARRC